MERPEPVSAEPPHLWDNAEEQAAISVPAVQQGGILGWGECGRRCGGVKTGLGEYGPEDGTEDSKDACP